MFLFDTSMSELGWLLFAIAIVIGIIAGLIFAYYLPTYKKEEQNIMLKNYSTSRN